MGSSPLTRHAARADLSPLGEVEQAAPPCIHSGLPGVPLRLTKGLRRGGCPLRVAGRRAALVLTAGATLFPAPDSARRFRPARAAPNEDLVMLFKGLPVREAPSVGGTPPLKDILNRAETPELSPQ